ncbi:MAG: GTPase Era [Chloroflexi bacterium]|nr:GTPase Era [Chloroflexota bacterium]
MKAGFVAVVGRPNVGKSTLMNAYLGQKIAIVSDKPQTTRRRQLGILTRPDAQIIFVDTPGIHRPRHALGDYMLGVATRALADSDAILFLADVSQPPTPEDRQIADLIREHAPDHPVILGLNKSDLLKPSDVLEHTNSYRALLKTSSEAPPPSPASGLEFGNWDLGFPKWMLVSATRGDNRDELMDMIVAALPEGPALYADDEITETQLRDLSAELVREAALNLLRREVPHGIAVEIEEFDETDPGRIRIEAAIFVERESHKGIVIGKGGAMLKAIGTEARKEIEALVESPVYLQLRVKVREDWRKNGAEVQRLGYGE